MKYVTSYGAVWRVSKKNYVELLRAIAFDQPYDLDKLGKCVIGEIINISNMSEEEAKTKLAELRK